MSFNRASVRLAFGLCLLSVSEAQAQPIDLREAARLDQQGKCDQSEALYKKALSQASPSAAVLNNAGNHYLLCGSPANAALQFERLLELDPRHSNANLQLGLLSVSAKHSEKALDYLNRVTSEDPSILFAKGNALLNLGRYEDAEQTLQRVAAQAPDNFDVLYLLGRAAARAQHYARAQSVLSAALKIRPESVEALAELGLAHAATKDFARAVYLLAQASAKAPQRAELALALARAAEDARFYGDAAAAYDHYLRLKPNDTSARRDRARVLAYTDSRREEGLREMRGYIDSHPNDPLGHYNLAQFTWKDEPDTSLAQLETALKLDPKFAPAHVSRAWLLHRLGRSEEAAKHLQAALRITPDNAQALDQLGLVYLALDRPAEAEKVLRRAAGIESREPEALLHLGRALMALNREDEAQRFLDAYQKERPARQRNARSEAGMIGLATLPEAERRAREIARLWRLAEARPDDPLLQRNLGELLLAEGNREQAEVAFGRLLELSADARTLEDAGKTLSRFGQHSLARRFLERAAMERPSARLELAMSVLAAEGATRALPILDAIPESERPNEFAVVKAQVLEAAGRTQDAIAQLSAELGNTAARPDLAASAALQLARFGKEQESIALLDRSLKASNDNELLLTRAALLAVFGEAGEGERQLKTIQSSWPEWDRPYLIHGLLLASANRKSEAMQKLKVAVSLGATEVAAPCALARLAKQAELPAACTCESGLRAFVLRLCKN